ncbi:MAG: hypothetical protein MUO38_15275, partial [Anaerolineales bacterium]|nr:hypothetical protein [Anaerolineales bacterium]
SPSTPNEGARLAREAGGSDPTVSPIRRQHEERDEKALVPGRNGSLLRARGFFITLRGHRSGRSEE